MTAEPASARQVVRSQPRRPGGRASSPALDDLYEPDAYGQELLRSLMRAQGGACAHRAAAGRWPSSRSIRSSPRSSPGWPRPRSSGLPLTLLILGGGIYPPLVLLGLLVRAPGGTAGAAVRRAAQGTVTEPASVVAIIAVTAITAIIGARGVRVARTPADFLVAARQVPAPLNASAISGEYLSAASFLGVAGLAMLEGLGALWYAVGYAAGYLVLLAAVAAPLRRFGAYTIPDFAEGRLGSPALRRAATATVILICGFYLLPQLKGAGVTLQVAVGGPVWIGVVVLGGIVTLGIASGGMKGITFVQAFQYWLKIVAIAVPALILLAFVQHPPVSTVTGRGTPDLHAPDSGAVPAVRGDLRDHGRPGRGVRHRGRCSRHGPMDADQGRHAVESGATTHVSRRRRTAPHVEDNPIMSGAAWTSPLLQLGGRPDHALAATYGVLLATVLGAMGLPHILVRFYTNRDGQAARRTTAFVLLLLGCFYIFPAVFAVLGRMEAPGLYTSGQTDSVVLVLPRIMAAGSLGVPPRGARRRRGLRRLPLDLVGLADQHVRARSRTTSWAAGSGRSAPRPSPSAS